MFVKKANEKKKVKFLPQFSILRSILASYFFCSITEVNPHLPFANEPKPLSTEDRDSKRLKGSADLGEQN